MLGILTSAIPEFISITISNLAFWFIPQYISFTILTTKSTNSSIPSPIPSPIPSLIPSLIPSFILPQTNIILTTSYNTTNYIANSITQQIVYNPITYLAQLDFESWQTIIIITFNLLAAIIFIILYYIEIRREIWLVYHFDYSRRYHSLHLTKYHRDYPQLFSTLDTYNQPYYRIYRIARIIVIANIISSSIIIITMNYKAIGLIDYKTVTSLFTNFWLTFSKVSRGIAIACESLNSNLGIAYYNTQNLSFNRIDPLYKNHISNSNIANTNTPEPACSPNRSTTNSPNPIYNNNNNNNLQPGYNFAGNMITSRRSSLQYSSSSSGSGSLNNSFSGISFENQNNPGIPAIAITYADDSYYIEEKTV